MPRCTTHAKYIPRLFGGGKEEKITTCHSFFILFLQRWRLSLQMLGCDRVFHFWGCVGVSLSSHREPSRQLAKGTGTCHPVAGEYGPHPSPTGLPQGGRRILLWSGLDPKQERDFTSSYGKLPKLLALLNQTRGWGRTVCGGGGAPMCHGETMWTFRKHTLGSHSCVTTW